MLQTAYRVLGTIATLSAMFSVFADIRYELHHGPISTQHREELYPLRSQLFYDFPYLYCSNPERESTLWDKLSKESTILSLAYDDNQLVGAVIALGIDEGEHMLLRKHPAYKQGTALEIDMVMIMKSHQRRGIARELLRRFQEDAQALGYTDVYGITVVRSPQHPLKPQEYLDLYLIWSSMGGTPTGLIAPWNWPTRCGTPGHEFVAPIDNMVQYWHKALLTKEAEL